LKNLDSRFAEVEKRVKMLVADNERLRKNVSQLERELKEARRQSEELHHFHGKRLRIREKIEKVLQSLETMEQKARESDIVPR
jgi:cell division septum initiation protein DivIVA